MARINQEISADTSKGLKIIAAIDEISKTELIRRILTDYVASRAKEGSFK